MHTNAINKIKRLEKKYKTAQKIIGKRNDQFHALRSKMYDISFIFRLMVELRKLDKKMFQDNPRKHNEGFFIIDYWILNGVQHMETFSFNDAMEIVDAMPDMLAERPSFQRAFNIRRRLHLMSGMKLLRHQVFRGTHKYTITADGKWFLMQTAKIMRDTFTAALRETTRYERVVRGRGRV